MWLYGSGFPKSMNIGLAIDKKNGIESEIIGERSGAKNNAENSNASSFIKGKVGYKSNFIEKKATNKWQGWGTCLKPAFEPIIVARKPFKGSLVDNVLKWGVGGLNIDECRVESSKEDIDKLNKEWDREWNTSYKSYAENVGGSAGFDYSNARTENKGLSGRFPANLILTYDETDYDDVCGGFPNTNGGKYKGPNARKRNNGLGLGTNYERIGKSNAPDNYGDSGSASRYFYCAKASKKDRDEGLEEFEEKIGGGMLATQEQSLLTGSGNVRNNLRKNIHPTVKPTELMQYLIRLVTPNGGVILDPFMGSGSTGKAVVYENRERNKNFDFIGIEKEEEYYNIAKARIENI